MKYKSLLLGLFIVSISTVSFGQDPCSVCTDWKSCRNQANARTGMARSGAMTHCHNLYDAKVAACHHQCTN